MMDLHKQRPQSMEHYWPIRAGHECGVGWGLRREEEARDEAGWVAAAPAWGFLHVSSAETLKIGGIRADRGLQGGSGGHVEESSEEAGWIGGPGKHLGVTY